MSVWTSPSKKADSSAEATNAARAGSLGGGRSAYGVTREIPHDLRLYQSDVRARRQNRTAVFAAQLLADALALGASIAIAGILSLWLSVQVFHTSYLAFDSADLQHRLWLWSYLAIILCCWFSMTGVYTARRPLQEDVKHTVTALLVMLMIDGFIEFASKEHFSRLWVMLVWPIAATAIPVARVAVRRLLNKFGYWHVGAAVLGSGPHYASVAHSLEVDNYVGYTVAYHTKLLPAPELPLSQLATMLAANMRLRGAETAILVPSVAEMPELDRIIDALNLSLIPYILIPPVQRLPFAGLSIQAVLNSGAILMTSRNGLMSPVRQGVKRVFDLLVASALLVCLMPLLLVIAGLVAASGGPILYGHQRIGRGNRPFGCLKFRSMAVNSQQILADLLARDPEAAKEWRQNFKLLNDPRITTVGKFLRKTSLDELPQLLNVLRGDMSLVGPRPVIAEELRLYYGENAFYYQLVRPGITGLWQVSGRSTTSYERRVFLDTCYVRNWSLWTDLSILFCTIPSVIGGDGAH